MNPLTYFTLVCVVLSSLMCQQAKPKKESHWDKMGEIGGVTFFINVYRKGDYNHVLWKIVNRNDCKIRFCPWTKTFVFGDKTAEHTEEYLWVEPKTTVEGKESVDDELSEAFYKKEVMSVEIDVQIELMDEQEEPDDVPDVSIALGAV
jgi:hypothetical protein